MQIEQMMQEMRYRGPAALDIARELKKIRKRLIKNQMKLH